MGKTLNRREFLKTAGGTALFSYLAAQCNSIDVDQNIRPNILWIAVEDISPLMSCYGYDINPTPHLDRLAEGGIRFVNTFMPAPVCSPCRSALITGMMQTTLGTHNHHSSRSEESAIYLPDGFKVLFARIDERVRGNGHGTVCRAGLGLWLFFGIRFAGRHEY